MSHLRIPKATFTSNIDINNFSRFSASVSSGKGSFIGGASVDLSIPEGSVKKEVNTSVAMGYTGLVDKKLFVGLRADGNFSSFSAIAHYIACKKATVAGKLDFSTKDNGAALALVGAYKCNPNTVIKLRASTDGTLTSSVKQQLEGNCCVTGSVGIPVSLKCINFGLSATLG